MSYDHDFIPPYLWHGARFTYGLDADKGTPEIPGQLYYATDTKILYVADGIASSADWLPLLVRPTAKGQILAALAANSMGLIPAPPADGRILVTDSTQPSGWKYESLSATSSKPTAKVQGFNSGVTKGDDGTIGGIGDSGAIRWATEIYDTSNFFDTANRSRLTAPATSRYAITFYASFVRPASSFLTVTVRFRRNGTTQFGPRNFLSRVQPDPEEWFHVELYDEVALTAGDYVEVFVNSGASGAMFMKSHDLVGFIMREV